MTHYFTIKHDHRQGVLMRILGAVSRRALPFLAVHDTPEHGLDLTLEITDHVREQLLRDWRGTVGVHFVSWYGA